MERQETRRERRRVLSHLGMTSELPISGIRYPRQGHTIYKDFEKSQSSIGVDKVRVILF